MKILIVGATSKESVGYNAGEALREHGHTPAYASRSGKLGIVCDIGNPNQIRRLLVREKPDVIIHAAGVFSSPRALGRIDEWKKVRAHLDAKSFGALALADAAVASRKGKIFIA